MHESNNLTFPIVYVEEDSGQETCCISSDRAFPNVFAQGPKEKEALTQKGPLPAAFFTMEGPNTKHSPKCHKDANP